MSSLDHHFIISVICLFFYLFYAGIKSSPFSLTIQPHYTFKTSVVQEWIFRCWPYSWQALEISSSVTFVCFSVNVFVIQLFRFWQNRRRRRAVVAGRITTCPLPFQFQEAIDAPVNICCLNGWKDAKIPTIIERIQELETLHY